jgi:hypothetical protein
MTSPSRSSGAEVRLLAEEVRPLLAEGPAPLLRAVDRAIASNDLGPLERLRPEEKRALLELLDGRVATGPSVGDPRALVHLCASLAPPRARELGTDVAPAGSGR